MIGRYGLLWKMTEEYYKMLKYYEIPIPEETEQLFRNRVRVPLYRESVNAPQKVKVKFKGHRPQLALALKTRLSGKQVFVVWPAEKEHAGKIYSQWVNKEEVTEL